MLKWMIVATWRRRTAQLLAILTVITAGLAVATAAPAATNSGACTYKMTSYPIYLNLTGSAARLACDEVGRGASGSVVRIYTAVRGAARCGFRNNGIDATATVYSPNALYGYVACPLLTKSLRRYGWIRVF